MTEENKNFLPISGRNTFTQDIPKKMTEELNVILLAEDELMMGKIEKYHPGAGPGLLTTIRTDELRKFHQEILNDFYEKGYIYSGFQILGPNRRMYYIFTKKW